MLYIMTHLNQSYNTQCVALLSLIYLVYYLLLSLVHHTRIHQKDHQKEHQKDTLSSQSDQHQDQHQDLQDSKPMIKAIICDMDGVLVDSEEMHWQTVLTLLKQHAPPSLLTQLPEPQVGWDDRRIWEDLKEQYQLNPSVDELILMREEQATQHMKDTPPNRISGSLEGLHFIKEQNPALTLAVVSASCRVHIDLSLPEYGSLFKTSLSGLDECEFNKPNPAPYLKMMARLGRSPTECVIIEDSVPGLRAALATGAYVIALNPLNPDSPQMKACLDQCQTHLSTLEDLWSFLNTQYCLPQSS
jgi:beta-phosphoglucomutase-like phosphatase (HAD superfamily)